MIKNPSILLSIVNTKLRDQYSSIEDLCDDLDYSLDEVNKILNDAGYILHKNPVCNEGILHNIGNFAKRTILGDNEKARKLFKNAGTRIVNIIKRGY